MLIILYIFIGLVFIGLIFYGIKKYGNPNKLKVNKKAPDLFLKKVNIKVNKKQTLKIDNKILLNLKLNKLNQINKKDQFLNNLIKNLTYDWNPINFKIENDEINLYCQSDFKNFLSLVEVILNDNTFVYLTDFLNLVNERNYQLFNKNYEMLTKKFSTKQNLNIFLINNYLSVCRFQLKELTTLLVEIVANLQSWKDYSTKYLISFSDVWKTTLSEIEQKVESEWLILLELEFGGYK